MPKEPEPIYRISFIQQDKLYEIYAEYISEDTLVGFIEAESIVFNENTGVVVDPNEERLKTEFKSVKRCYIPMHTIVRIDEMVKQAQGSAKIRSIEGGNVSHFPTTLTKQKTPTDES